MFDDLYTVEVMEEVRRDGEMQFVAQWEKIDFRNGKDTKSPCARTSHTCTVYKNRFLVIIGGETEVDASEVKKRKKHGKQ